ncbi:hypothetical protein B0A49_12476 [Cryomyces minteri]|uniref:Autophagy-related protein 14 n=1 Tax=Cryomyces minteri TaxID=331657 RepID=A0A4U0WGM6_9PEZI|nr:hypothetical protein B0A49_12476 [Cryomyces minteri]
MAANSQGNAAVGTSACGRERPWLYPSNRKLRHLQGITLRNLTLSPPSPARPRGKTTDDEALPFNLKTPAKVLALRENRQLGHSRSSADLRPIQEAAKVSAKASEEESAMSAPQDERGGSPNGSSGVKSSKPTRPTFARLRRRSTMEWSGASPQQRQKKLEDVTAARMADTFFSLHVVAAEDPIYVSEEVPKAMNPNFRDFDLNIWGAAITRLDELSVKFWSKTEAMEEYQLLVELALSLRSLTFIGRTLDGFHHPLPQNCILFHLSDGFYTTFTDMPAVEPTPFPHPRGKAASNRNLPTSSFDALLRLSKLDDSIQDAIATRERISDELNCLLQDHQVPLSEKQRVAEANESLEEVQCATLTLRRQLNHVRRKRDDLQISLHRRRDLMKAGRVGIAKTQDVVRDNAEQLEYEREALQRTKDDITNQRRRVCEDLQKVYPIDPVPNKTLAFTIRGLHLPNSAGLDDANPEIVAAALGYIAHVLDVVSLYLDHPLPYPVQPRSSSSTIYDHISMNIPPDNRVFPLFAKGAIRYRFEYGVFLLNKDIEILLSSKFGVKILDIRQTLPNLKHLLYLATAGKGELPARKAGGIPGLLRAGGGGGSSMPPYLRTIS